MAITFKQRAYAGLAFMAAGLIPVLIVGSMLRPLPPSFSYFDYAVWFIAAPLLVTGINGALFGGGILEPSAVRSAWLAILRGMSVSVVSFVSVCVMISAWDAYNNEYTAFRQTLMLSLIVGFMVVGWQVTIVGMATGWLLFKLRRSGQDK
jgi:hypothetical protein